jgi:hypothetical protein
MIIAVTKATKQSASTGNMMPRQIPDTGYWILDAGCWILDTGYWIPDT